MPIYTHTQTRPPRGTHTPAHAKTRLYGNTPPFPAGSLTLTVLPGSGQPPRSRVPPPAWCHPPPRIPLHTRVQACAFSAGPLPDCSQAGDGGTAPSQAFVACIGPEHWRPWCLAPCPGTAGWRGTDRTRLCGGHGVCGPGGGAVSVLRLGGGPVLEFGTSLGVCSSGRGGLARPCPLFLPHRCFDPIASPPQRSWCLWGGVGGTGGVAACGHGLLEHHSRLPAVGARC